MATLTNVHRNIHCLLLLHMYWWDVILFFYSDWYYSWCFIFFHHICACITEHLRITYTDRHVVWTQRLTKRPPEDLLEILNPPTSEGKKKSEWKTSPQRVLTVSTQCQWNVNNIVAPSPRTPSVAGVWWGSPGCFWMKCPSKKWEAFTSVD